MEHLYLVFLAAAVVVAVALALAIVYRRVVPTNMTHIVQSAGQTVSYGKGQEAGNVYYAWPAQLPRIGISVLELPESVLTIRLDNYEAYDQARLPFVVDVAAFFRIENSQVAAQRVANFHELEAQLKAVLQGSVRRILATNALEKIMESRSELGVQFTQEVDQQIREWGVTSVKSIEFMDLRDSQGSEVIANIMLKEKSRIEKESRVAVAENHQAAQLAEIAAERAVEVQRQDAMQQVGLRTAEKDKTVGIATERAQQEIQDQARATTEKRMHVLAVERERTAEIARTVAITEADARKQSTVLAAEAKLQETLKAAEGIAAEGAANAQAQEKLLMAPVTAQITLAKEIGENQGYQTYLVTLEQVKAGQTVGIEMAQALSKAELKVISTGGSEGIMRGVSGLVDKFTPEGGTNFSGMLTALAATDEGKALVGGLVSRLTGKAHAD